MAASRASNNRLTRPLRLRGYFPCRFTLAHLSNSKKMGEHAGRRAVQHLVKVIVPSNEFKRCAPVIKVPEGWCVVLGFGPDVWPHIIHSLGFSSNSTFCRPD